MFKNKMVKNEATHPVILRVKNDRIHVRSVASAVKTNRRKRFMSTYPSYETMPPSTTLSR